MTITVMPADLALTRPTSCGTPFRSVEMKIVGADGNQVRHGVDGGVHVRGPVVMTGYWGNPAATRRALAGGWLDTGDVGHVDELGFLFLTDRAKDVIITGGSNVYPREVEEALLTHRSVREAAVIGVPDPLWGESVTAFVVVERPVAENELVEHCKARIASFKKPRRVLAVADLPKNSTGKILKRDLRNRLS